MEDERNVNTEDEEDEKVESMLMSQTLQGEHIEQSKDGGEQGGEDNG